MLTNEYPVEMLCGLLACPRSSYYYQEAGEDVCVRDAIEQIAAQFPRYGYRRITAELGRRGMTVNHKRVCGSCARKVCWLQSNTTCIRPTNAMTYRAIPT